MRDDGDGILRPWSIVVVVVEAMMTTHQAYGLHHHS
jgi:hypothetical protein